LGIDGEIVRGVPPLDLPNAQAGQTADRITHTAAVRLFVDRARAVNPSFVVSDDSAAAIARVCVAVDGIPLALELAAARTRVLTVAEVYERLEHDIRILGGGGRDIPARHQSMRATIGWSHDLLDQQEQALLRRLSVFAGGWRLEMAEDVCSGQGIERSSVLDLLGQLVDKSLVVVDLREPEARYRLLEPIRQHARERLDVSREAAMYAERHARALLDLARYCEFDDFGPDEITSLDHFEVEHANLRVALRWALTHGAADSALSAASALYRFWERRGHLREGCAWLEEALAAADKSSRYRGPALNGLAFLYWRLGDLGRAQVVAEQALTANREQSSSSGVAWALGNLGAIAYFRGEPGAGVDWLEQSVCLARLGESAPLLSVALTYLARALLRARGPHDPRVSALLHESLSLAAAAHARYAMAHALMTLGDLHWRMTQQDRAVQFWNRALLLRVDIGDRRGIPASLERLALAQAAREHYASAAWLFGFADAQHGVLGIDLSHDELQDHTDLVRRTHERLGNAFSTAWSAGALASLDEAVARGLAIAPLVSGEAAVFAGGRDAVQGGGWGSVGLEQAEPELLVRARVPRDRRIVEVEEHRAADPAVVAVGHLQRADEVVTANVAWQLHPRE
jgi:non-specific serine/threonine protein kinase